MSNSRTENAFGVILFHSVQGAIHAEKLLMSAGIGRKLIPVPRQFSSDCGFCLRFDWNDREKISRLIEGDPSIEAIRRL